jgi:hypothetical protein
MGDELKELFAEWQQQLKPGDAQMEANNLVAKIGEALIVRDIFKKIEEVPSGNQNCLN